MTGCPNQSDVIGEEFTELGSNDGPNREPGEASTRSMNSSHEATAEASTETQPNIYAAIANEQELAGFDSSTNALVTGLWKSLRFSTSAPAPDDPVGWNEGSKEGMHRYPRPWRTTLIRWGPISGILSMAIAIASIFASLGVLAGSNKVAVAVWSVQPSEYLAVLTAIANLSMRYACIQGIVIAWWTRALRGSTLSKLHWHWRSGSTLIGAFTSGRQMGWFGLACIFSTLVTVDGPLLQRATRVVRAPIVGETVSLNVTMAAELPQFYRGSWLPTQTLGPGLRWSPEFNKTIPTTNGSAPNDIEPQERISHYISRNWPRNEPLVGVMRGCHRSCKAKLIAPALAATSCETHLLPVNFSSPTTLQDTQRVFNLEIAPPLDRQAFMITSSLVEEVNETLTLVTGFTTKNACVGHFNYTVCTLQSAVGEYNVSINNDKVTLDSPGHPVIVALANNTKADHEASKAGYLRSTLASVAASIYSQWDSYSANYIVNGDYQYLVQNSMIASLYERKKQSKCTTYTDPREDVIASINQLMVYIGAKAAKARVADPYYLKTHMDPGWPINTTTTADVVGDHNVYHTDFRFFVAAAVIEVACILLVAPTYWGWWHLGRPCSFSPLEVAKAFESPLLTDVNSNSSGRDLATTIGEIRVRYGATRQYGMHEKTKIAFANPVLVDRPDRGQRFDL